MRAVPAAELEAGLDEIRRSPRDGGAVELIVRRPATDEREILDAAELDVALGLVGDAWHAGAVRRSPDGAPSRHAQLTLMSSRVAALLAGEREAWAAAGDQLYVDLDLSVANLPPGTRLAVGSAIVEVSEAPHTGCAKFAARFGQDALGLVNSLLGRELRLRGLNASVVQGGTVRTGDAVRRM
jgi:MOSC domain-containing protein YiiM